jgi:LisH domain-containing protein ARMC9
MIQFDVIKWIVETIRDELDSLCDYTLEYATALLMNLSLRVEGKNKCEEIPDILSILNELIESENLQVRTHVNGTLYSILTRKSLKQLAL